MRKLGLSLFGATLLVLTVPTECAGQPAETSSSTSSSVDGKSPDFKRFLQNGANVEILLQTDTSAARRELDKVRKAERSMQTWPQGAPRRELVRAAIDLVDEEIVLAQEAHGGKADVGKMLTFLAHVREYCDKFTPDDGRELWVQMRVAKVEVQSIDFVRGLFDASGPDAMSVYLDGIRDDIEEILKTPESKAPGNAAVLHQLRGRSFWGPAGTTNGSIDEAMAEYGLAAKTALSIGNRTLAREVALEEIDAALAMKADAGHFSQALSQASSVLPPQETSGRTILGRRVLAAYGQADASLSDLSKRWFQAWRHDLVAAHAPIWADSSHSELWEIYPLAPLLGDQPDAAEAFRRFDDIVRLERATPLTSSQTGLNNSLRIADSDIGLVDDSRLDTHDPQGILDALGVDAVLMPVPMDVGLEAANAQKFLNNPNSPASDRELTLHWAVLSRSGKKAGSASFTSLDSRFQVERIIFTSLARAPTSFMPDLLNGLENRQDFGDEITKFVPRLRFILSGQNGLADQAMYDSFGAPLDTLFGDRCASPRPLGGSAAPRVLLIIPASLDGLQPIPLMLAPSGRRLGDCYTFLRAPDLSIAIRISGMEKPDAQFRSVAGLWPGEGKLPMVPAERALIASTLPKNGLNILPATAKSLSFWPGEAQGVLHIASHGYFRALSPYDSAILLSNDHPLTVGSLLSGKVRVGASLVVLAACESGLSSPQFGPVTRFGLPAAFLEAGAKGVVAAQWKVRDDAAALTIAKFYELLLLPGARPSEALRQAQIWLRNQSRDSLLSYLSAREAQLPKADQRDIMPLEAAVIAQAHTAGDKAPYSDPELWGAFAYFGID